MLGRFASGVTVVTTQHGGQTHGMTANAFVSVSLDPPLVLVAVDNRAHLHRLLPESGRYGVSILAEDQQAISNHFAGRPTPGVPISFVVKHDMPVLEGSLGHLVAQVVQVHHVGDHTLYVGQVEYLDWRDEKPLLFFAGKYQLLSVKPAVLTPGPEDDFSLFSIGSFTQPTP